MSRHTMFRGLAVAATATLSLSALSGCGSSSGSSEGASSPSGSSSSGAPAAAKAKDVDACGLITPAELSQAVGVTYTKFESVGGGSMCNVTGAPTDSFVFHVDNEDSAITTWTTEVATIKQDDGSVTDVSGIGDRAAQGAVKEFATEYKGHIIVILNADVNNQATAADFTRSKAIATALVGKL